MDIGAFARGIGAGIGALNPFKYLPFGPGSNAAQKENTKARSQQETETALTTLRQSAADFEARMKELNRRCDEATLEAKKLVAEGQKPKALAVLKRKKMLQKQVQAVQNNVDRLQEQIFQMEMSQSNIMTISALQEAAQAGKANLQANDIEDVDLVLDEIAEQNDQMSQIQDALAQTTMADGIDDDDLEAELNELQNMSIDEEFSEAPVPATKIEPPVSEQAAATTEEPPMPSPPIKVAIPVKTSDDAALEKLMAETGMTAQ